MKIGFIGAGKVGTALGAYFVANNLNVIGYASKNNTSAQSAASVTYSTAYNIDRLVDHSDIIFITVPDSQIASVWAQISPLGIQNKIICHCSGAISSAIFEGAQNLGAYAYSVHPLVAVANKHNPNIFKNAHFTIEGSPHKLPVLQNMLSSIHTNVSVIATDSKVLYHASAVVASNFIVAIANIAHGLFKQSGFDNPTAIASLMESSLQNIQNKGITNALTGPIERNDMQTVEAHITALQSTDPSTQQIYTTLSQELIKIAQDKNSTIDYTELEKLLRGEHN